MGVGLEQFRIATWGILHVPCACNLAHLQSHSCSLPEAAAHLHSAGPCRVQPLITYGINLFLSVEPQAQHQQLAHQLCHPSSMLP